MSVVATVPRAYLIDQMRYGVEMYGDKTNPRKRDSESCLYTKTDVEGDENPWCIVGYVATCFGWTLPEEGSSISAWGAAERYGWPISVEDGSWITDVQRVFDGDPGGIRRSWRNAWSVCVERQLI